MIVVDTNYNDTLHKIEQLKLSLNDVQRSLINQIPQGITNEFEKSKSTILNWVEEIEITLNEFKNNENE
jgi:hypothetical protein